MGQAKRRTTKIRPKAVGSGIFGRFPNFDKCRSEVAGDIISSIIILSCSLGGVDVRAKLGESGDTGRII